MMIREQILPLFGGRLRRSLQMAEVDYESLRELRLRVSKPVSLLGEDGIKYLSEEGALEVRRRNEDDQTGSKR